MTTGRTIYIEQSKELA